MELVLHIGAHFTEEERLAKCLLRNQKDFAKRAVAVPSPDKYRGLLRGTLNALASAPPTPDARAVLLDAFLDGAEADRIILSDPNFQRPPSAALQQGQLYPAGPTRMMRMAQLFPEDKHNIFLAIRNPATLLPLLPTLANKTIQANPDDLWGGRTPHDIKWSETILQLREAVPTATVTVWCSEDSPLIWAEIIREMAGLETGEKIIGGFDLLSTIMSAEGMKRLRAYLKQYPVMTDFQKRRVIVAFLDKFAVDEEFEQEIDIPGWTETFVEELTEVYDNDVEAIRQMPGVAFISP